MMEHWTPNNLISLLPFSYLESEKHAIKLAIHSAVLAFQVPVLGTKTATLRSQLVFTVFPAMF